MKTTFSLTPTILFLALAAIFTSCESDDETSREPLAIPASYDGASFDANTVTQAAVLNALNEQVNAAKVGRTAGVVVSAPNIQALYVVGTPSLRDISTPYFISKMEGIDGHMNQLAEASGNLYALGDLNGEGGVFGGYLFNEYGLEHEQLIDKGQFGAVLYQHAVHLLDGSVSLATVDQAVAIFGSNPTFPNTNNAATSASPDKFMANYAARRDNNDGTGLYFQIKNAFIQMQAAVKAGGLYNTERDQAIGAVKLSWEKINAATVINYCHGATSTLSNANPTDAQMGSALHAIGEGIGFMHGWRTIASDSKLITDQEIDEVLALFNAPVTGDASVYTFATDPLNQLPKLQQIITRLQTIYGFTDAEIEGFKQNWVNVQGR